MKTRTAEVVCPNAEDVTVKDVGGQDVGLEGELVLRDTKGHAVAIFAAGAWLYVLSTIDDEEDE